MILEIIAQIGATLDSPYLYCLIIILGLIFSPNKAIFGRTLLLTSFTIIYNLGLKSIWQIPLQLPLEGWAFPSGHMHAAFVFWGWLAIESRRIWISEIVFMILCTIAYGLLYYGYHQPIDIAGSIGFGSLSLFLYWLINQQITFRQHPYLIGYILSAIAMVIFVAIYPYFGHKADIRLILGILMSTTVIWTFISSPFNSFIRKILRN